MCSQKDAITPTQKEKLEVGNIVPSLINGSEATISEEAMLQA
jgi:hypothetical protein